MNLYAFFVLLLNVYCNIPFFSILNYPVNGTNYITIHQEVLMLEANVYHQGRKLRNELHRTGKKYGWKEIIICFDIELVYTLSVFNFHFLDRSLLIG